MHSHVLHTERKRSRAASKDELRVRAHDNDFPLPVFSGFCNNRYTAAVLLRTPGNAEEEAPRGGKGTWRNEIVKMSN